MVVHAVDGAVGPFGGGGGVALGVFVVGGGVVGEGDPAGAPVDLDLTHAEEFAVAAPAPGDLDDAASGEGIDDGLDGIEVRWGDFRAFDAEDVADGGGVVLVGFDGIHEHEKAGEDAGGDGVPSGCGWIKKSAMENGGGVEGPERDLHAAAD